MTRRKANPSRAHAPKKPAPVELAPSDADVAAAAAEKAKHTGGKYYGGMKQVEPEQDKQ